VDNYFSLSGDTAALGLRRQNSVFTSSVAMIGTRTYDWLIRSVVHRPILHAIKIHILLFLVSVPRRPSTPPFSAVIELRIGTLTSSEPACSTVKPLRKQWT
jgi:hypothetical protein